MWNCIVMRCMTEVDEMNLLYRHRNRKGLVILLYGKYCEYLLEGKSTKFE